jgi:hypothetical protein
MLLCFYLINNCVILTVKTLKKVYNKNIYNKGVFMKNKVLENSTFNEVINRMYFLLKTRKDTDVAKALNMNYNTFKSRGRAKSVPFEELVVYASENNINLDWLLTGEGNIYKDETEKGTIKKIIKGNNNVVSVGSSNRNFQNIFNTREEINETISVEDIKKIDNFSVRQKLLSEFEFINSTLKAFLRQPNMS